MKINRKKRKAKIKEEAILCKVDYSALHAEIAQTSRTEERWNERGNERPFAR